MQLQLEVGISGEFTLKSAFASSTSYSYKALMLIICIFRCLSAASIFFSFARASDSKLSVRLGCRPALISAISRSISRSIAKLIVSSPSIIAASATWSSPCNDAAFLLEPATNNQTVSNGRAKLQFPAAKTTNLIPCDLLISRYSTKWTSSTIK